MPVRRKCSFVMRSVISIAIALLFVGYVRAQSTSARPTFQQTIDDANEREAYGIALEAYLYGYPRVELARRVHNETNRVSLDQVIFAPPNRFFYFNRLARPGDGRIIKAPNNDTLYASAYLDLSDGPVVLRIPEVGDRLYVALLVDASGAIVQRLSRTVSGPGGVDHVFVGPGSAEVLQPSERAVRVAANDVWLLMRLATDGSTADEAEATRLMRGFRLAPLEQIGLLDQPQADAPVGEVPLASPSEPFGRLAFFHEFARMLLRNPVPAEDRGLQARWERIGLRPGAFEEARLSGPVRSGIERAIVDADEIVAAAQFGIATTVNGWNYSLKIGRTGSDWALNAAIARGGYGNLPEDSVYYQRSLDASGQPLTGAKRYLMTFASGALPPVGAFWSVTAYDMESFDLIANSIRRYSVGDRTQGITRNLDGSLTIAIQKDPPSDPLLRTNWLPVVDKPFYLIIRTYDPEPVITDGRWAPPEVTAAR